MTVGAEVYPDPPAVILIPVTRPALETVAVAVAPVPPPPVNVTDGGKADL